MKVNWFFTYLGYLCILVYIFTQDLEVFRASLICLLIALTFDNIKPLSLKNKTQLNNIGGLKNETQKNI